jgi:hypothetical protein
MCTPTNKTRCNTFIPFEQWGNWLESGIVLNKAASRVSQVWAIVFLDVHTNE